MEKIKFTNTKKTIYSAILILSLILSAFSCGNITGGGTKRKSDEQQKQKTYLSIVVKNISTTRNSSREVINEHSVNTIKELSVNNLSDLVLKGKLGDDADEETLLEAASVAALPSGGIELEAGRWDFTLSAKLNGIVFSGTKTYTIVAERNNEVAFTLKPTEHFGGYEITFDVTDSDVTHYSATLKNADTNQVIEEVLNEGVTTGNENTIIKLSRDILDTDERLASGTYELDVKFYNAELEQPLNTWKHYITIVDGTVLTATIDLEYNNVYTITYLGDENATIVGGIEEITKYSARSSFDLPVLKKTGYFFKGWYLVDADGNTTTTKITNIPAGTQSNKTVKAVFEAPVLYVTATGNDTTGDGSQANPLKTIDGACAAIEETGEEGFDWTIYVTGEITGIPLGTSGNAAIYGPSVIPETITNENAKSILITGTTDLDEDGIPADSINRGGSRTSGGPDGNGTVLTIKTAVPVTITNLKITGGAGSGQNGGGMTIAQGATVSLGDGALVARNRNTSNGGDGGGIHNEGTLYMYGSAVVGDKSQTKYAVDSSGDSAWNNNYYSNWAGLGGGIFNGRYQDETVAAKLYLGYKPGEDGLPEKKTLTGGLFYNSGKGGALYNAKKSYVYFASGIMAWNGSDSQEAGAVYNDGTFEMTGGNIINNRVSGSGGGVCNAHTYSKFIMCGGIINHNKADQSSGCGGGVYNCGQFFMSGSAVIGEKYDEDGNEIKSVASETSFGNISLYGAGIYNYNYSTDNKIGILYLGYMPDSDGNPKVAPFSGGIYHNYSTYIATGLNGGGAIQSESSLMIAGGTIAYNATSGSGGAICFTQGYNPTFQISGGVIENNEAAGKGGAIAITSTNGARLTLSDNPSIPAGSDKKHDIYYNNGTKIEIADALSENFSVQLTPYAYDPEKTILALATGVETTSVETECSKFQVTKEINENTGTTILWSIGTTGKLVSPDPLGTITISLEQETFSDISVSSRYYTAEQYASYTPGSKTGGTLFYASNTMGAGKKIVFTAPEAPADHTYTYEWYLDGQSKSPLAVPNGEGTDTYNLVLVLDSTDWIPGTYDLLLIIKDSYTEDSETKTDYYSYEMHIKVRAAQQ